ncbi:MFS transporter [Ramlibacter sp. G-1-2-2]|uniref:MFS transporter n=1 Tax=Ramlibacter agri TaxID=2728837 RepID=A0A848H090_9BURK|nr:MFS transporter [Ramlibacter agri]NML44376.1 MFS transporter [Ramlibacter agri]
MTCASVPLPAAARPRSYELPARWWLPLLGSVTVSFLAGSSAPTPLYPVYQGLWHFSAATVTAVFASYVVVLLAALLVFGRVSDYVGRKPVILAALLLQLVAMALFATAGGVAMLFAGRILQGLGTGAALAAIGAAMLDVDKQRGTIANAVAPGLGTGFGAVLSGLLVHFLPAPTLLVYAVLALLYVLQIAGIALLPEPGQRRPGVWSALRPQLALPASARGALRGASPMLVAGWALAGFFASLGPALVHRVFGFDASLGGGLTLFVMAGSAAATVLVLRNAEADRLLRIGAIALAAGSAGVLVSVEAHSVAGFLFFAVLSGIGFGAGFQGGMRSTLAAAAPAERAGLLAVVFLIAYVAMGLPALLAGFAVVQTGNLVATGLAFGGAVLALSLLALRLRAPAFRQG